MNRTLATGVFLALALGAMARAETKNNRYSERPSVLEVSEADADQLNEMFFQAHVEAAALFMALHGKQEMYLLARDAEYLYDILRLLNPKAKNIHIINVSRQHLTRSKAERLRKYLMQEGISAEAVGKLIAEGRYIVLIDTGFAGTIPYFVKKAVLGDRPDLKPHLRTHLLASEVGNIPSLRVFTSVLGLAADSSPHETILDSIEHVPHYTSKSLDYEFVEGRWTPVSPDLNEQLLNDTNVQSRQASLDIMGAAKSYVAHGGGEELYQTRLGFYERLLGYLENEKTSIALIADELTTVRQRKSWSILPEAMLDMLETLRTFGKTAMAERLQKALLKAAFWTDAAALDRAMIRTLQTTKEEESKKIQFFEANPDLSDYVIDPDLTIPEALATGNFTPLLEVLSRGYDEEEFVKVLSKSVARHTPSPANAFAADRFVRTLWEQHRLKDEHVTQYLHRRPDTIPFYGAFLADCVAKHKYATLQALYEPALGDGAAVVEAIHSAFGADEYTEAFVLTFARETMLRERFSTYRGRLLRNVRRITVSLGIEGGAKFLQRLREALAGDEPLDDDRLATVLSFTASLRPSDAYGFLLDAIQEEHIVQERLNYAESRRNGRTFNPEWKYVVGDVFITPKQKIPVTVVRVERMTDSVREYIVRAGAQQFRVIGITEDDEDARERKRLLRMGTGLKRLDRGGIPVVEIIEFDEAHAVLECIKGETAQDWLKRWAEEGFPKDDARFVDLVQLVKTLAGAGLNPKDLRARDLTWDGRVWVLTRSTSVKTDVDESDVLYHVLGRIEMWGAALDACQRGLLVAALDQVN